MATSFHYDRAIHIDPRPREDYLAMRVLGCLFVVTSAISLIRKGEITGLEINLFIAGLAGLLMVLAPKMISKISFRKKGENYVKIDGDSLEWKLGQKGKQTVLKLSDISSSSLQDDVISMRSSSGEVYQLPLLEVYAADKVSELKSILLG